MQITWLSGQTNYRVSSQPGNQKGHSHQWLDISIYVLEHEQVTTFKLLAQALWESGMHFLPC